MIQPRSSLRRGALRSSTRPPRALTASARRLQQGRRLGDVPRRPLLDQGQGRPVRELRDQRHQHARRRWSSVRRRAAAGAGPRGARRTCSSCPPRGAHGRWRPRRARRPATMSARSVGLHRRGELPNGHVEAETVVAVDEQQWCGHAPASQAARRRSRRAHRPRARSPRRAALRGHARDAAPTRCPPRTRDGVAACRPGARRRS